MAQAPLTRNQKTVLDKVPEGSYTPLRDINERLGRGRYDIDGTRATLDSLVRRGLVLKTNKNYRKKPTTPKSGKVAKPRSPVTTPTFRSPILAASLAAPKKDLLKSVTEFWVDPNDLVTDDPSGMIDTSSKIYRSGDDKLTFRFEDSDSYIVLKLGDTITALEALRDKPISQFGGNE